MTFTADDVAERFPSLAVIVWLPADFNTIPNEPTPLTRLLEDGRSARESIEVSVTVPLYPVAVLPKASFAVTEMLKPLPATLEAGTELRIRLVAPAEATVMAEDVAEMLPSVAVRERVPFDFRLILKVPAPLLRVAEFGISAKGSLDVMLTVPEYPVATLLLASGVLKLMSLAAT